MAEVVDSAGGSVPAEIVASRFVGERPEYRVPLLLGQPPARLLRMFCSIMFYV